MTLLQCHLRFAREPLQISYPRDFNGKKSISEDDPSFFISQEPRFLTNDEIGLVETYLPKLPYQQALVVTGCVMIDPDDPMLGYSHNRLDEVERRNKLPSSRYAPGGGERETRERVLIIRESGVLGATNGLIALGPSGK